MIRLGVSISVFLSLCTLSACDPKIDLPPIIAEGKRVKIGTDMDVQICQGTIVKLDTFVEDVEEVLQISPREGKIGIYVIDDLDWVAELCPNETHSCYIPKERGGPAAIVNSRSFSYSVYHEVVHDIHYNTEIGPLPNFLAEGIAAAWGSEGSDMTSNLPLDDLLAIFETDDFLMNHDLQVARFVRYLVAKYTPTYLVQWAKGMYWKDTAAKIKEVFHKVYGISMDEEWALFGEGEAFPGFARCIAPVIPWFDNYRWMLSFDADCSNQIVQTNFEDPNTRVVEVVIDVPKEQDYFAEYSIKPADKSEEILHKACEDTNYATLWVGNELHPGMDHLFAERYVVQKAVNPVSEPDLNLTIRKPPEPAYCDAWAQDCAQGRKCQLLEESWPYIRVDCAPLSDTTLKKGEACEPADLPQGDGCDMGLECTEFTMTCQSLCENKDGTPLCTPDETCVSFSTDHPGLCLPACDPLHDSCGEGRSCKLWEGSIFCVPWEDDSGYGDTCFSTIECAEGLICTQQPGDVPGCENDTGCCTAFCDLNTDNPDETCPDFAAGQRCAPLADGFGYCSAAGTTESM